MSDFFGEPAAMVEQDQSAAHNLMVEARAELNTVQRQEEETISVYRSVAEKIAKSRELLGRGNWLEWCAKRLKISTRQVERIVQLGNSPDNLSVEEQMAILWGHPVRAASAAPKPSASASVTTFSPAKLWGGHNRFGKHVEAFAKEKGLLDDPCYLAIVEAHGANKARFKELEERAKQ